MGATVYRVIGTGVGGIGDDRVQPAGRRCGFVGFTIGGVTVCGGSRRNEGDMAVGTSPIGDGAGDV